MNGQAKGGSSAEHLGLDHPSFKVTQPRLLEGQVQRHRPLKMPCSFLTSMCTPRLFSFVRFQYVSSFPALCFGPATTSKVEAPGSRTSASLGAASAPSRWGLSRLRPNCVACASVIWAELLSAAKEPCERREQSTAFRAEYGDIRSAFKCIQVQIT